MSSGMEKLFETKSFDASVWHGFPMGRHGIGRLAPRSFQAEDKKSDPATVAAVDTNLSNLAADADAARHPALAVASGALVIIDALQLWVEGEGVGKELLRRIEWHWHPHYISGLWSGGGISIAVEA